MSNGFPGKQKFYMFMELLDPAINGLLFGLRREFSEGALNSNIHITIRGPYRKKITQETFEKCVKLLNNEPILIHGIGMFENPEEYVVYIKVSGDHLPEVCWKPDFPKKTFGCNPHISLYRGTDKQLAKKALDFLNKESLKLICNNYRLTPYTSKQPDLFPSESTPFERILLQSSNDNLVTSDIVKRAAELVRSHRYSNKHVPAQCF